MAPEPRDVAAALERISEIHGHLAKGEVYQGYRPGPAAATGILGLGAGLAQPLLLPTVEPASFIGYWVAVAALNLALHAGTMAWTYRADDEATRRRTRRVVGQFVPCVAAGALLTAAVASTSAGPVGYLPGTWALLFSMGIFASRPYLPHLTGWVALFYLGGGAALLLAADAPLGSLGLGMGGVFGLGQLAAAAALHRGLPRDA